MGCNNARLIRRGLFQEKSPLGRLALNQIRVS